MSVYELARAKINLTLKVLGRRADGYHELESLVTFADVYDVVSLHPGADGSVVVTGPFANYISGENLLVRALALLRKVDPELQLGLVRLGKQLPVAAGIGGGSADAAALLRAVRRANVERAPSVPWLELAARLGADVPVCLESKPAMIRGVGERVEPCPTRAGLPPLPAVLINPGLPLATADVFRALDAAPMPLDRPRPSAVGPWPDVEALIHDIRSRGNDLERPATALMPVIGEIKAALTQQPGCLVAALSGSGPTCFSIFDSDAHVRSAAKTLASAHPDWWIAQTSLEQPG